MEERKREGGGGGGKVKRVQIKRREEGQCMRAGWLRSNVEHGVCT
jgi:hypothetical protein